MLLTKFCARQYVNIWSDLTARIGTTTNEFSFLNYVGNIVCEIGLGPLRLLNVLQKMAWYHQATGHYLGHCWPGSKSPYGVITPNWVNRIFGEICTRFLCFVLSIIFVLGGFIWLTCWYSLRPVFTKRTDVLSHDLVKSRNREIRA